MFFLYSPQTVGAAFCAKSVAVDGKSTTLGIWVWLLLRFFMIHTLRLSDMIQV